MIPMSCPTCGSRGEVPLDRLNSRLKCRKCGTLFYMDDMGSIMLGDPNAPGKGRRKRAEAGPAVDLDLGRMIRDVPKPVRIGVPILAVVVAVGYGIATLIGSLGLPDDVEGRTSYVGELFVDNKLDELRALATSGTEDDLAKWHEAMRPRLNYDGARRSNSDVFSSSAVMRIDASTAQSFVSLVVANPATPLSPGQKLSETGPLNTLTMPITWAMQDGEWKIHGTSTLNDALRPAPEATQPRRR